MTSNLTFSKTVSSSVLFSWIRSSKFQFLDVNREGKFWVYATLKPSIKLTQTSGPMHDMQQAKFWRKSANLLGMWLSQPSLLTYVPLLSRNVPDHISAQQDTPVPHVSFFVLVLT